MLKTGTVKGYCIMPARTGGASDHIHCPPVSEIRCMWVPALWGRLPASALWLPARGVWEVDGMTREQVEASSKVEVHGRQIHFGWDNAQDAYVSQESGTKDFVFAGDTVQLYTLEDAEDVGEMVACKQLEHMQQVPHRCWQVWLHRTGRWL